MISCPRCGASAAADTKFCTACGAGLAASAPAAQAPIGWDCPACAAHWDVNIRFCMKCGAARPGTEAPAAEAPPAAAAPPIEPARQGVNPWLVIAAFALLLAGAAASGYLLYKRYSNAGAQVATAPQQSAQLTPPPAAPQPAPPETQAPPPATIPEPVPSPVAEQPPQVSAPEPVRRIPRPSPLRPASPVRQQPLEPAPQPAVPVTEQPPEPVARPETPPPEQKPPEQKPPERVEMLKPEPPPAVAPPKPAYTGPATGTILWSGRLAKDGLITIDGRSASEGTVNGELPGVPVIVNVQPAEVGVAEAPSPANGWKRLVLRSRVNRGTVVTIRWSVLR